MFYEVHSSRTAESHVVVAEYVDAVVDDVGRRRLEWAERQRVFDV